MSKVVKLSSVMEREEKLKEIYEGLEEIKDQHRIKGCTKKCKNIKLF